MSDKNETHVHVLEDGTVLEHTHGEQEHVHTHNGTHPHHHSHAQTKAVSWMQWSMETGMLSRNWKKRSTDL